ncbi:MAG: thiol:disulfide interchange protein DsbA/DsbL [Azonexus sp.]|jgi:thiol:disulfide interchange protein DsbA|uniref:thiol:disulfide interchange protein DsbA/DsbL n=1 Tax=Azonexus sp. TaxID=1872668 RepID=UPI0028389B3D|nr:thiol:disulfide interchange protein DsbA/DsbL [Azonexus sp.]MDR0777327.1 thiol:disulfide interchange protein DsbA/DsbL [Azonexus sp.]
MKFDRRRFISALAGAAAAIALAVPVQAQTAGKDYTLISPAQPTEDPAKIEVLEFFSYGCPHCADLQPLLGPWAAKQGADVVVKRVPVSFGRAAWGNIARLYYALEITGDLARLDGGVFRAVHKQRLNLYDERNIMEWVAKNGVDQKKFAEAFNSFGVNSKVRRGDQLSQAYKIEGVPALAIDGKYLAGGQSFDEMLANADKLIAKARSEKAGKK